jgi:hypothetical protein
MRSECFVPRMKKYFLTFFALGRVVSQICLSHGENVTHLEKRGHLVPEGKNYVLYQCKTALHPHAALRP